MQDTKNNQTLDARELSDAIGVHIAQVYRYADRGMPVIKRRPLVADLAEVKGWLDEHGLPGHVGRPRRKQETENTATEDTKDYWTRFRR